VKMVLETNLAKRISSVLIRVPPERADHDAVAEVRSDLPLIPGGCVRGRHKAASKRFHTALFIDKECVHAFGDKRFLATPW